MSGTILRKLSTDLWPVLQLVSPDDVVEKKEFVAHYVRPIDRGQSADCTEVEKGTAEVRQKARRRCPRTSGTGGAAACPPPPPHSPAPPPPRPQELSELLAPLLLRRLKSHEHIREQLEAAGRTMTRKRDFVVYCKLSDAQRRAYQRLVGTADFQLLIRAAEDCDCGSGEQRWKCCHGDCDGVIWGLYDHVAHAESNIKCPFCMVLPFVTALSKCSNNLDLLKASTKARCAACCGRTDSARPHGQLDPRPTLRCAGGRGRQPQRGGDGGEAAARRRHRAGGVRPGC